MVSFLALHIRYWVTRKGFKLSEFVHWGIDGQRWRLVNYQGERAENVFGTHISTAVGRGLGGQKRLSGYVDIYTWPIMAWWYMVVTACPNYSGFVPATTCHPLGKSGQRVTMLMLQGFVRRTSGKVQSICGLNRAESFVPSPRLDFLKKIGSVVVPILLRKQAVGLLYMFHKRVMG